MHLFYSLLFKSEHFSYGQTLICQTYYLVSSPSDISHRIINFSLVVGDTKSLFFSSRITNQRNRTLLWQPPVGFSLFWSTPFMEELWQCSLVKFKTCFHEFSEYEFTILHDFLRFSKLRKKMPQIFWPVRNFFSNSGNALGIWICGCSLYYKRELWASKSAGAHSTKSLKISGCKRWCPKDLRDRAPAAPCVSVRVVNFSQF